MSDKEKHEWIIDGEGSPEERDGDDALAGDAATGASAERDGDTTPAGGGGDGGGEAERTHADGSRAAEKESGHGRVKKAGRAELLDLIQHKNEMLQALEKDAKEIRQEVEKKEDKLLRMAAEFENYRKRTRREWELHQQQANAGLIKDILGVIDDFDRALEAAPDEEDTFTAGVRLIYNGLLDVLRRTGLSEVETAGRVFDPQYHEAMGETATEEVPDGHVAHVIQKGYLFCGELLRPARVIVARKPETA
ncbi:MAG: nucleotide exchange factor GrpE [Candidatus Krumholzibacteriota bacterium]|nr:nucleotide exchange factor GrpE [Candidatus Krumholzibacteriota bacterium]